MQPPLLALHVAALQQALALQPLLLPRRRCLPRRLCRRSRWMPPARRHLRHRRRRAQLLSTQYQLLPQR